MTQPNLSTFEIERLIESAEKFPRGHSIPIRMGSKTVGALKELLSYRAAQGPVEPDHPPAPRDTLSCPSCGGSGHIDDAKGNLTNNLQFDFPEADGTDLSHPAWWRGHDATVDTMCVMINRILDGTEPSGGVSREPWQSLQVRLRELLAENARLATTLAIRDRESDFLRRRGDKALAERAEVPRWMLEMIKEHPAGSCHMIQHDGFHGHVIGYYQRHDGKRGVVMQFGGTNIVHVYGEKWLT